MINLNTAISTIMSKDLVTVQERQPLSEFREKFNARGIHHILVCEGDSLKGIISTEDINQINTLLLDEKLLAEHLMTTDLTVLAPEDSIDTAVNIFLKSRFRAIPIKVGDSVVGIVTPYDILKLVSK